jgi:hypothetical protein
MVDGPFGGFHANFNLDMTPPFVLANTPPIANKDNAEAEVNTPITINVVANDSDVEDGTPPPVPPVAVTITTNPIDGSVVNNGDGTITYTPNAAFLGIDTFQYTLTDSGGAVSNTATVTVTVLDTSKTPPVDKDDDIFDFGGSSGCTISNDASVDSSWLLMIIGLGIGLMRQRRFIKHRANVM